MLTSQSNDSNESGQSFIEQTAENGPQKVLSPSDYRLTLSLDLTRIKGNDSEAEIISSLLYDAKCRALSELIENTNDEQEIEELHDKILAYDEIQYNISSTLFAHVAGLLETCEGLPSDKRTIAHLREQKRDLEAQIERFGDDIAFIKKKFSMESGEGLSHE